MARKRDYAAEYARRIARAAEKGYSKAIARGHAPRGTVGLKRAKALNLPPGFVIARKKPRKGYVATPRTRSKHLADLGLRDNIKDFLADVTTNQDEFVSLLTESGFTEREAYTLWFS